MNKKIRKFWPARIRHSRNLIKSFLSLMCAYAIAVTCLYMLEMQCAFAKNKLFYYEPEISEIDGTVVKKTVTGHCDKDNFAEDKNIKEVCPFLILDQPIDVKIPTSYSKTPADPTRDKPEKNVKMLQISNTGRINYNFEVGQHVRIQGILFRHFANCHHTRVLIDFDTVKIINR